jgi:hypothetical protein
MHRSLMRWLLPESSSSSIFLSEHHFRTTGTLSRVDVLDLTIRLRLPGEALENKSRKLSALETLADANCRYNRMQSWISHCVVQFSAIRHGARTAVTCAGGREGREGDLRARKARIGAERLAIWRKSQLTPPGSRRRPSRSFRRRKPTDRRRGRSPARRCLPRCRGAPTGCDP